MEASERAALILKIKRYTKAKTISKEVAAATLIDQGIYTAGGQLSAEYGGESQNPLHLVNEHAFSFVRSGLSRMQPGYRPEGADGWIASRTIKQGL